MDKPLEQGLAGGGPEGENNVPGLDRPAAQAGAEPLKEVAVSDLPLFIVITGRVYDVDLPVKEFSGEEEFEEYLRAYAGVKFGDPAKREKFIKRHLDAALYMDDEIAGDRAWEISGEDQFNNARICGFGILKTQSKQFYMFQTPLGPDLPSQLAAFQALTYGRKSSVLALFASAESRARFKSFLGGDLYASVMKSLGAGGLERPENE